MKRQHRELSVKAIRLLSHAYGIVKEESEIIRKLFLKKVRTFERHIREYS